MTIDFAAGTATDVNGFIDTFLNFEQYVLTDFAETITGSNAIDTLSGAGGNDLFYASAGADVLDGGADSDTVDYSSYAISNFSVTLNGSTPVTLNISGADNHTLSNIENIIGSTGGDTINGDDQNNTLDGYAGNDTIFGGDGDDTILGNAGNDTLLASDGADSFDGGDGADEVDYSALAGITGVTVDLDGATVVTATVAGGTNDTMANVCLLYTSPSPRDKRQSRMPSSA